MKILVREYNNGVCNYVWKTMRKINPIIGNTYYTDDGMQYRILSVIKISHDYRKSGYVICNNCGEVIKRSNVIKHYEEKESDSNCIKCDKFTVIDKGKEIRTIKPDGTCLVKYKATPACACKCYRYYGVTKSLSEINKATDCKYYACRRSSVGELPHDFLFTNPNPYKNIITEKRAIEVGWKYLTRTYLGNNQYTNNNGKVIAEFDTNGILIGFTLLKRNNSCDFMYSDVYDTFIDTWGRTFDWMYCADTTKEKYIRQIKKLYE